MLFLFMTVLTEEQSELVEKLYKDHYKLFYSIAYNILKSSHAAEDAVHTSFAKISEKIEEISRIPCHKIRAYCIVIVENDALAMIRAQKKTDLVESLDEKIVSAEVAPEDYSIKRDELETVRQYISRLSEEDRKLIIMRFYKDYSFQQIADHFGITADNARKRGQRVLKRMHKLMTGESPNDD